MNQGNYLTVQEFKDMNPEVDFTNYPDPTVSGMIQRASSFMDNYLQYSLIAEDIVNEKTEAMVSSQGNLVIYTRKVPIISVAAIQLKMGTVHLDLNLVDAAGNARYDIPARGRSVTYPYQEIAMTGVFSVRNFYQLRGVELFSSISYRAGFDVIPPDLKDACNLIAKDIFIRQANPMDLAAATQGAVSMSFKDRTRSSDEGNEDSKWMKDAKNILSSYRKVV